MDTMRRGNNAALNDIDMAFTRFLETVIIELISRGPAGDVTSMCFEQWSQSDKFMKVVLDQIVSNPLLAQPVAGSSKKPRTQPWASVT